MPDKASTTFDLTHPAYIAGSNNAASNVIEKIRDKFREFGEGKYVNFINLPLSELPQVQAAFPNHTVKNTNSSGSIYYEVRPLPA